MSVLNTRWEHSIKHYINVMLLLQNVFIVYHFSFLFHIWTTNNFRVCLSQNAEDFTPVNVTSVMMKFLNKKSEM